MINRNTPTSTLKWVKKLSLPGGSSQVAAIRELARRGAVTPASAGIAGIKQGTLGAKGMGRRIT